MKINPQYITVGTVWGGGGKCRKASTAGKCNASINDASALDGEHQRFLTYNVREGWKQANSEEGFGAEVGERRASESFCRDQCTRGGKPNIRKSRRRRIHVTKAGIHRSTCDLCAAQCTQSSLMGIWHIGTVPPWMSLFLLKISFNFKIILKKKLFMGWTWPFCNSPYRCLFRGNHFGRLYIMMFRYIWKHHPACIWKAILRNSGCSWSCPSTQITRKCHTVGVSCLVSSFLVLFWKAINFLFYFE